MNVFKKYTTAFIFFISFLVLFVASPPKCFAAGFGDSVSIDAGIKLTLGNLQMTESTSYLNNDVTVTAESLDQIIVTTTLANDGTLMGKLGYKIESDIPSDLREEVTFSLYEGDNYVADLELSGDYLFLNQNSEAVIFEPGSQKTYSIRIETTSLPVETRNFQVAISFILSQTNATEPQQMFYDEVDLDPIAITLEKEITEPVIDWPPKSDSRWKTDATTGVLYINEFDTEIMYFSETSDGKRINSLDNLSIYVDYSQSSQSLIMNEATNIGAPYKAEKIKIAEGKYRIDVSIDTAANGNSDKTTLVEDWYRIVLTNGLNQEQFVMDGQLYAKRLLLTTDTADYLDNTNYYDGKFPIFASKQSSSFRLAYIDNTINQVQYLTESSLRLSEYKITFNISKIKSMIAQVNATDNAFTLKIADDLNRLEHANQLGILITGNSGKELIIQRKVQALPVDPNMAVPSVWYGIGDGDRIKISTQQLAIHLIEKKQGKRVYYASDPENPPVLYLMTTGNNYFGFEYTQKWAGLEIEEIVYSGDRKVMRITFSFELPDLNLNVYNQKFAFKIPNGLSYIIYYQEMAFSLIPPAQMMTSQSTISTVESTQVIQEAAQIEEAASSDEKVEAPSEPPSAESAPAVIAPESPQPTTP